MAACKIGEFAKSKAGHDKEEIFIIINKEEEYVYLVDGKSRILDKPKKKKIKHIQVINQIDEELQRKLETNLILRDEDIKRAIKSYKQKIGGR
ncbi:MAG: KOW domain-containing RNA-binding protein [Eubacteriales bacterium]|nr:KOW domain-containing RNA-binding protein [Eubacteriales bacterium]